MTIKKQSNDLAEMLATPSPNGLRMRMVPIDGVTDHRVLPFPLHFQVGPLNNYEYEGSSSIRDYETVGDGEYSQRSGGKQLRTQTIETLTLDYDAPWFTTFGIDPERVQSELFGILDYRTPVYLYITSDRKEYAGPITIRGVSRALRKGEKDTLYWTIEVKEWRDNITNRRTSVGSKKVKLPTKHKLTEKDTLRSLSKKFYGSAEGWKQIAKANNLTKWGGDKPIYKSRKFKVGNRIIIPEQPTTSSSLEDIAKLGR